MQASNKKKQKLKTFHVEIDKTFTYEFEAETEDQALGKFLISVDGTPLGSEKPINHQTNAVRIKKRPKWK